MVNKTFTSNTDGSTVRIVEQIDNDIVALDNGQRVSVKRLNDATYYTENIDPSSFFNRDERVYSTFIDRIKSIPDSHIKDSADGKPSVVETGIYTEKAPASSANSQFYGNTEAVPVYHDDPEEEKRQLLSKYNGNGNANAVMSQVEKFKDLLDEEAQVKMPAPIVNDNVKHNEEGPITRIVVNGEEDKEIERQYQRPQPTQNPQTSMFKGIKRNTDFKVKFEIDNKIPRPDFISMWEDSYEASIIEFLADEFTNTLLSNPQLIKEQIISQLRLAVYGKEELKEVKKTPIKKAKSKVENKITKTAKIETTKKVEVEEAEEIKEVKATTKKGRNKKVQES